MTAARDRTRIKRLTLSLRDSLMITSGALIALITIGGVTLIQRHDPPLSYQPSGITGKWLPPTVTRWDVTIIHMAERYNIDANLIAILMTMESGGDPKAKSGADAVGLMQITPLTAEDIARKYLKQPVTKYDLTSPTTSIEFGAAYLTWLRDQFGSAQQAPSYNETVELIAAYNGGPSAAYALGHGQGLRDTQTVVYSRDAFNMWRERLAAKSPTFERWKARGGSDLLTAAQASQ